MAIIDRIKFDAPSDDILVWKYPRDDIRLGAQLVVNESQEAVFFKGGQALDVFGPGTHTLSTANIPLLSRVVNLPFGGETPFTAEIWYVNKTVKRDLKWGTKSPIPVLDPVYRYPIHARAFGRWGMRIKDSQSFITQIVGTLRITNAARVEEFFAGEIGQKLSDGIAEFFVKNTEVSVFNANAQLNELSSFTEKGISQEFERYGIEVANFNIERISIPDEEMAKFQEVLGKRMEIDQISQARVGQGYTTMRTFDTLEKAAGTEGGAAGGLLAGGLGLGIGLGAGVPVGKEIGQAMSPQGQQDPLELLKKLKQMLDEGLITKEEYEAKKKEILARM